MFYIWHQTTNKEKSFKDWNKTHEQNMPEDLKEHMKKEVSSNLQATGIRKKISSGPHSFPSVPIIASQVERRCMEQED